MTIDIDDIGKFDFDKLERGNTKIIEELSKVERANATIREQLAKAIEKSKP